MKKSKLKKLAVAKRRLAILYGIKVEKPKLIKKLIKEFEG